MNIVTLQYFVSAAELSSFTKAAKQNFVAQTAVSQQMAKLESKLNVKLFIRDKNRVRLTRAGQVFYDEAKAIIEKYDAAVQKVQKIGAEDKEVITIGYKERHELKLLTKVIQEYQMLHPEVGFVIREDSIPKLVEEVKLGVCDIFVNISCTLSPEERKDLCTYTIHQGDMMVAVSKHHPKADREYLEPHELAEEKFIVLNIDTLGRGIDVMNEHCMEDGCQIHVMEHVTNLGSMLMGVEMNRGVSFVQDIMIGQMNYDIAILPIRDSAHKYNVDVIWSRQTRDKTVRQFLSFIERHLPVKGA